MRVLATILVLLTSIAGFICSYEFAYRKIAMFLRSDKDRTQIASVQNR